MEDRGRSIEGESKQVERTRKDKRKKGMTASVCTVDRETEQGGIE